MSFICQFVVRFGCPTCQGSPKDPAIPEHLWDIDATVMPRVHAMQQSL